MQVYGDVLAFGTRKSVKTRNLQNHMAVIWAFSPKLGRCVIFAMCPKTRVNRAAKAAPDEIRSWSRKTNRTPKGSGTERCGSTRSRFGRPIKSAKNSNDGRKGGETGNPEFLGSDHGKAPGGSEDGETGFYGGKRPKPRHYPNDQMGERGPINLGLRLRRNRGHWEIREGSSCRCRGEVKSKRCSETEKRGKA